MANILLRPGWHIAERLVTPEAAFLNRRTFLRQMSFAGAAGLAAMPLAGCAKAEPPDADSRTSSAANAAAPSQAYPASRNHEATADDCPVNVIKGEPKKVAKPYCLKLSYTQLGQCAAAVIKRWE